MLDRLKRCRVECTAIGIKMLLVSYILVLLWRKLRFHSRSVAYCVNILLQDLLIYE